MPQKYFQIDGIATFVHHGGPTTLPGSPPVVERGEALIGLHGIGGNGHLFAGVDAALGGAHTLVSFDQPGHGRSGSLDGLGDVDRMGAFTWKLIERLGLEQVVLVGHDLGAAVALRCTLMRPEAVRALVICSAGDHFEIADEVVEQMRRVRDGKARRPFDPTDFSKQTAPDVVKQAFVEGLKTDPRATYGDLVACTRWNEAERLSAIGVPTLVVHGEDDHAWVHSAARALSERIQGARLEVIPAAGHALLVEAPGPLAERVVDFLGALAS